MIVVYRYKHELALLKQEFPIGESLTPQSFDRWRSKQLAILFLNQHSDCMGFNLQSGGYHIIWNSLTFSPANFKQMIARLHRPPVDSPVYCHFLIAENTVDEEMLSRLNREIQQIERFNLHVHQLAH